MLYWITVGCYFFLYISILFLWLPYKFIIPVWSILFSISCLLGLISNQIDVYAILTIAAIAYALYCTEKNSLHSLGHIFSGIVVIFVAYGLGAHLIPSFHNLKVLSNVYVSIDGRPFTLYLNFDKAVVGLLILGLTERLFSNKNEWIAMLQKIIPKIVICSLALLGLAAITGEVHYDPKIPDCLPIWLITNLLFVCVAEEGFFRGFIQKNLAVIFKNAAAGNLIAIVIASLLFGFAHYAGGIVYSIWGTIAGLGYGWVYHRTNKIESSIVAHFCLNTIHFLLFTYPAILR